MSETKRHFQVTAALILQDGRVLITRRPPGSRHAGRWDFPGGKQEPGETLEACIIREIREELGLTIQTDRHFLSVDHDYGEFSLTLHAFLCRALGDEAPSALDAAALAWVVPDELRHYDLLPPDRPIADALRRYCQAGL